MILFIVLILAITIYVTYFLHLYYRGKRVYKFLLRISKYQHLSNLVKLHTYYYSGIIKGTDYDYDFSKERNKFIEEGMYTAMLYSNKPLKIDEWYSKKEIKKMFNINDN